LCGRVYVIVPGGRFAMSGERSLIAFLYLPWEAWVGGLILFAVALVLADD